jgi:hypothetical protein
MRKTALIGAAVAALGAASATAQSSFMADMIGQAVAGYGGGRPSGCYNGRWTPSAESIAKGPARVEAAMANYRQVASTGTDLRKVIGSEGVRRYQLDGQLQDVRAVRDPFLPRIARLERLFITSGNENAYYRAQWRAYAADGSEIGIYDALMFWKSNHFMSLDLYTPRATGRPVANMPFCESPGDVELWQEAKAKREAEKAAKRAAKEAASAAEGR